MVPACFVFLLVHSDFFLIKKKKRCQGCHTLTGLGALNDLTSQYDRGCRSPALVWSKVSSHAPLTLDFKPHRGHRSFAALHVVKTQASPTQTDWVGSWRVSPAAAAWTAGWLHDAVPPTVTWLQSLKVCRDSPVRLMGQSNPTANQLTSVIFYINFW